MLIDYVAGMTLGTSIIATISGFMYLFERRPSLYRISHRSYLLTAILATILSAYLFYCFVAGRYEFSYVFAYSNRALALHYKISAFWAGREGTILLWLWYLTLLYILVGFLDSSDRAKRFTRAAMGLSMVGFAAYMLFRSYPFARFQIIPPDGRGLNPLLQDPWMMVHPPVTFLGYAGFSIPFSAMIAYLITKEEDLFDLARKGAVFAWIFMTLAIAIGGYWAYKVLGWGGYWAWDPVETASLVPWLAWTGFLHVYHSGIDRRKKRVLLIAIAIVGYATVIFATAATRSGFFRAISPHSF